MSCDSSFAQQNCSKSCPVYHRLKQHDHLRPTSWEGWSHPQADRRREHGGQQLIIHGFPSVWELETWIWESWFNIESNTHNHRIVCITLKCLFVWQYNRNHSKSTVDSLSAIKKSNHWPEVSHILKSWLSTSDTFPVGSTLFLVLQCQCQFYLYSTIKHNHGLTNVLHNKNISIRQYKIITKRNSRKFSLIKRQIRKVSFLIFRLTFVILRNSEQICTNQPS